jgi:N-acetylglucosaminyl-diphospho-decaprenol L-rhamnosyltransferase
VTIAIVVTFNSARWVHGCLSAMAGIPTIVVDNASRDGTVDQVRRDFPEVQVIARNHNGGYAVAINEGIRAAKGDDVMIVNPDLEATPQAIASLETYLRDHPEVALAAPRLLYPDGATQESARTFPSPLKLLARRSAFGRTPWGKRLRASYLQTDHVSNDPRPVDFVIGAAMLVRRAAIDDVGGMDERMFLYGEDVDWCYRMWERGWEVHLVPSVVMTHHYERSSRRTMDLRSAAVRHHWASMLKLYALHPRLLLGRGPRSTNRGG